MPDVASAFRDWILSRSVKGCEIRLIDTDHIALTTADAAGSVTFFEVGPAEPRVVEFLIERKGGSGEAAFHLHFELTDLARAEELFTEMLEVLMGIGER